MVCKNIFFYFLLPKSRVISVDFTNTTSKLSIVIVVCNIESTFEFNLNTGRTMSVKSDC